MNNTDTPPKPATPEQPADEGLDGATYSPRRCDAAHRKINEATQIRPFDEKQERDGRWHYVHRTDAHSAADEAWKEGVASFAAWLVDNAEGETITEELLMEWATRCIRESDPLRDILENIQDEGRRSLDSATNDSTL